MSTNTSTRRCRFCETPLTRTLVDLGKTPLANSYLMPEQLDQPEPRYPLHAMVCDACFLVQVEDVVPPDAIFSDYAYFSSYSDSWVAHAKAYCNKVGDRFGLDGNSLAIEIASNDGYLLQHFVAADIPVLGIEPAANVADVAIAKGVPTDVSFFGVETATRLANDDRKADLIASNNVLAHVPDINDFVGGIPLLLKAEGVWTIEFPHLLNLIAKIQFDTIYHEHFSYLSLGTLETIFARHNLRVFDVEEIPTHGGSLRLYVCHMNANHQAGPALETVRTKERAARLDQASGYDGFTERVALVRAGFLEFVTMARADGKTIAAYGAAAKGNTFLNYCGITENQIIAVADRSAAKQGKFLPGSRIPIVAPEILEKIAPDYLLILPWNLREEISSNMAHLAKAGSKFVTAVPEIRISD